MEIILLNPHQDSSLAWYREFPTHSLKLDWGPSQAWFPALVAPVTLARAARDLHLDIVHAPANVAPFIGPRMGIRRVATIHDVAPLALPSEHRTVARLANATTIPLLRWTADAILTDTQAAANDLVRLGHIPHRKIHVASCGVTSPTSAELQRWRHDPPPLPELGGGLPYLLAVGDVRPRKNLKRVVEAFGRVVPYHPGLKLVIVGQAMHSGQEVFEAARRLRDAVVVTGYIGETELHRLYANASGLVIPSLYEGFGLPAVEAMAHGIPVIASFIPSLKEVVEDVGLLVDPYSVESISDAMDVILRNPDIAASMSGHGRKRAATFTWRNTAERPWLYTEIWGSRESRDPNAAPARQAHWHRYLHTRAGYCTTSLATLSGPRTAEPLCRYPAGMAGRIQGCQPQR